MTGGMWSGNEEYDTTFQSELKELLQLLFTGYEPLLVIEGCVAVHIEESASPPAYTLQQLLDSAGTS